MARHYREATSITPSCRPKISPAEPPAIRTCRTRRPDVVLVRVSTGRRSARSDLSSCAASAPSLIFGPFRTMTGRGTSGLDSCASAVWMSCCSTRDGERTLGFGKAATAIPTTCGATASARRAHDHASSPTNIRYAPNIVHLLRVVDTRKLLATSRERHANAAVPCKACRSAICKRPAICQSRASPTIPVYTRAMPFARRPNPTGQTVM